MASLVLNGVLQASGEGCGCSDGGGAGVIERLGLACASIYESVVSGAVRVNTGGAVGDAFVDLDLLEQFRGIEVLYLKSSSPMAVVVSRGAAELESDAGTFPTGFVGGEAFSFEIDGVAVAGTFLVGDQSLAQVVARLNAAAALAGLPTPRFAASGSNRIAISGVAAFDTAEHPGRIEVVSTPAEIPFSTVLAVADGSVTDILGTMLVEFPRYPNAPSTVQVSGNGSLTILAAGRTSP